MERMRVTFLKRSTHPSYRNTGTCSCLHTSQHGCDFHVGHLPSLFPFLDGGEKRRMQEKTVRQQQSIVERGRCALSRWPASSIRYVRPNRP